MKRERSAALFAQASQRMPGGVNSPVRSFAHVGEVPVFVKRAYGSRVEDEDGNVFIDYVGSWGPLILGHRPQCVVDAVHEALDQGTGYGLPTAAESEMAQLMIDAYPGMEEVRMVNSGTEAAMSAIRLARAYTGRDDIIKFAGCYHGHSDSLLVSAGSGALTFGVPSSPGVPHDLAAHTFVCRYHDLEGVRALLQRHEIAALIIEPVAANMGLVLPKEGFLSALRALCDEYGALLIFDEVITGFRLSYGGAAQLFGVTPDLACFGKIIGGGLPVGAYGGKKAIMEMIAPAGPVYQAGTLSGNPLAMHAGLAQLSWLRDHPELYDDLARKGQFLKERALASARRHGIPLQVHQIGSLLCLFFADGPIYCDEDVMRCDTARFGRFFHLMLEQGILISPSQFEVLFLSAAHTQDDLDKTAWAMERAMSALGA